LLSLLKEKNPKKFLNNTKFTKKNNIKNKNQSNKIWLKPLSKLKETMITPSVLKLPKKTKKLFSLNNVPPLLLLISFHVPLILDSVSIVANNMLDSTSCLSELNVSPLVNTLFNKLSLRILVMKMDQKKMNLMNKPPLMKMLMFLEITMKLMKEPLMKPPPKKPLKKPPLMKKKMSKSLKKLLKKLENTKKL